MTGDPSTAQSHPYNTHTIYTEDLRPLSLGMAIIYVIPKCLSRIIMVNAHFVKCITMLWRTAYTAHSARSPCFFYVFLGWLWLIRVKSQNAGYSQFCGINPNTECTKGGKACGLALHDCNLLLGVSVEEGHSWSLLNNDVIEKPSHNAL